MPRVYSSSGPSSSAGGGGGGKKSKSSGPFSSAAYHKPTEDPSAPPTITRRNKGKLQAEAAKAASKAKGKGKRNELAFSDVEVEEGNDDSGSSKHPRRRKTGGGEDPDPLDVYSYAPLASKGTRQQSSRFDLTKDEAKFAGIKKRRGGGKSNVNDSDDDDNRNGGNDSDDSMAARIQKVARKIAGEGSFNIRKSKSKPRRGEEDEEEEDDDNADGDDESLDSDAAFDGSEGEDEDKWGDVFDKLNKQKKGKELNKKRKQGKLPIVENLDVDLSESDSELVPSNKQSVKFKPNLSGLMGGAEDDDEEDDDEELEDDEDNDEELEDEDDEELDVDMDEDDEDEDEDEDEEEEDDLVLPDPSLPSDADDSDSDLDPSNPVDLLDFVNQLSSKRKAGEMDDDDDEDNEDEDEIEDREGKREKREKKRRVLRSEKGPGGREDAGVFGITSHDKVSLASLIAADPSLKSSASALLRAPTSIPGQKSSSVLKSGTLSAPLPTIVQERLNREAAYEETKKEGDKWGAVMKRVKEAEYLRFPLQAGGVAGTAGESGKAGRRGGVNSAGDVVSGFKPKNELESAVTALLESANLKDTQVAQAEDDALQAQDLTVEEIAQRRAELRYERELLFRAESRSKRVAKIKSKTYRKLARKRAGKAGGGEMDLDDLRRLDPEKAEEEALKLETLRARERATLKHSSKGGRFAARTHGAGETSDKRREIEEMLSRGEKLKRRIRGAESDDDSGDDVSEADTDDMEEGDIRDNAFDELAKLKTAQVSQEEPSSGVMAMKFMQRAMAKKDAAVDLEEEELRKQLESYEGGGLESESEDDGEEGDENMMRVGGNTGRMVFAGNGNSVEPLKPSSRPVSSSAVKSAFDDEGNSEFVSGGSIFRDSAPAEPAGNPWLTTEGPSNGRAKKRNTAQGGKEASASDKASQSLKKAKATKTVDGKARALDDARVDIDLDSGALLPKKKAAEKVKKDVKTSTVEQDEESSEDELGHAPGVKAFKQRDLVAEAFAGDNVIEDFAAEKRKIEAADAPKEEDLTLAGWGSWGGKGVKKNKNAKKFIKVTAGIETSQRKDFNRSNVIVSEKRDRKASKFLVTDLPYPYTSAAQYEASFATPVGSDWNTRATHQRATMPRITKKPGAIIEPVTRLF